MRDEISEIRNEERKLKGFEDKLLITTKDRKLGRALTMFTSFI